MQYICVCAVIFERVTGQKSWFLKLNTEIRAETLFSIYSKQINPVLFSLLGKLFGRKDRLPPSCNLLFRQLQREIKSPLSILVSRINNSSSLSCYSSDLCSRSFTCSFILFWTCSSTLNPFWISTPKSSLFPGFH